MANLVQQLRRQRRIANSANGLDLDRFDAYRHRAGEAELHRLVAALPDREGRQVAFENLDLCVGPAGAGGNDDAERLVVGIVVNLLGRRL